MHLAEPRNMFEEFLKTMVQVGASDIHLVHNNPVAFRIDKKIHKSDKYIKGQDIFKILIEAKAIDDYHINNFHEEKAANFAYTYSGIRFRGSLVQARGEYTCVIRQLPGKAIPLSKIGLPPQVVEAIQKSFGLILVTGPTGSGKTTTLTSMVDFLNQTQSLHIATAEDPIEFIHKPAKAIVTQREIGYDSPSFAAATKDVLRRDPDIILIGELRDIETIEEAIIAAGTGHLVLATLHTNNCADSIDRVVNVFPAMQQQNIRSQLASNLRLIVNQRLFPKNGGGVVPAYEVLFPNKELKKAIRRGDIDLIEDLMEEYSGEGNILMREAIRRLQEEGLIAKDIIY